MNMSQELKSNWLPKARARYEQRNREGKSRMLDARGIDESFLDDIEADLLVMDQLKHINIQRKLVASEQGVPGRGFSSPGLIHRQLLRSATTSIYNQSNARREKRFKGDEKS